MADKPTPAQLEAINFDSGNCLVSAGAGSGKTKVLTLRISRLVAEGKAKLSELLVLTFTNKAAFEIKDRVRKAIANHPLPEVRAQSPEVEGASITTFDSFALDLVTRYHYRLGIDKEVSLVPQHLIDTQTKLTINEILEERAALANEGKDPGFLDLAGRYCVKNADSLIELILAIDKEGNLKKDKAKFLREYVDENFSDAFFEEGIRESYRQAIKLIQNAYKQSAFYEDAEAARTDQDALDALLSCKDYESLHNALPFALPRAKKGAFTEEEKERRNDIKDKLLGRAKGYVADSYDEAYQKHMGLKADAALIFELVRELNRRLDGWKRAHATYSFADIAALARDLVQDPEVVKELKNRFKFAMIDEYQDTSDLQDQLIERLECESFFVVGDIKQSIYRFRNANPKNFKARMDLYAEGKGGTLITMAHNFRSREQIIDAVNAIFGKVMTEELGGVDYQKGQALKFGNHGYDASKNEEAYGYQFYRYTPSGKGIGEDESEVIARDIAAKIASGYNLHRWKENDEDDKPQRRPCAYKDFAILIREKEDFAIYERKFHEYGIPINVINPSKVDEKTIKVVLGNLIRLCLEVKNGLSDSPSLRHLFVSVKRSFVERESDEAIYASLKGNPYLNDGIFQRIRDILEKSISLGDLVRNLIVGFDLISKLPLIGEVKENYEVMESWVSYLSSLSKFSWGLPEVVAYFDDLDKTGINEEEGKAPSEQNAVQLMSIHASKGLEFPVVYLPSLMKETRRKKVNFTISRKWGVILPNQSEQFDSSKGIFYRLAQTDNFDEDLSERMRLFYVALTRAKEHLVFVLPKAEEAKPSFVPTSFSDFLDAAGVEPGHSFDADSLPPVTPAKAKNVEAKPIEFKTVSKLPEEIEVKRASKDLKEPVDQGSLRFGEKLHRLMELTDVSSKDVSWIEDEKLRSKIEQVLALPCFKDSAKARQYHEYSFLGPEGQEGIIDLFLLYEDHVDLIDFKAARIDDPAYASQLRFYAEFLEKSFKRPVSAYLVSISKGRQVRVEL